MIVKLKRYYSIQVKDDLEADWGGQIVVLGNYSKSKYEATNIVSIYGIAPTVRENHGQVTAVIVYED